MESLQQIWQRLADKGYKSDKGDIHSYLPVYEKLLEPYRHTALNVLEIGCFNGDSIRLWSEYFTKAHIHGIDCSTTPHDGMADLRPLINDITYSTPYDNLFKCHVHILDAENIAEVSVLFINKKFDVIIEDAGHEINQQLNLYKIWSKYLADGGIYIVEDVQDIGTVTRFHEVCAKFELHDRRGIKNRYDDVLIVVK